MLKLRLLTAAVLVPLVVFGVFSASRPVFVFALGIIMAAAAWEWAALTRVPGGGVGRMLYAALVAALLWVVYAFVPAVVSGTWLIGLAAIGWLLTLIPLARFREPAGDPLRFRPVAALLGLPVLVIAAHAMIAVHGLPQRGPLLFMSLLLIVWVADSAAYFAGHRWGRNRLAPCLSPGKTREGAYGALVAVAVLALVMGYFLHLTHSDLVVFVIVSMVAFGFSIVGDLAESLLKRNAGEKDSGHLLPGHGGMLDRIDSLLAASPIYAVGIRVLYS